MPTTDDKRDLRVEKTEKLLVSAMDSLIKRHNFKRISVMDICGEALISRASFYAHFSDKYDFLKWWMISTWPDNIVNKEDAYEVKERKVNQFINEHKPQIKNLFLDADNWTFDVIFDVLHSILHVTTEKMLDGLINPKYIVLSNFYIGGMIHYIVWQVKNDFPENVATMNVHLYEAIRTFQGWH